jgi:cell division transport system permease protein
MAVSADYVAKETATNLWRNRMMALAAILTVAVSLSLVGTSLLLRQAVSNQLGEWNSNVNLQIFLQANVSRAQQANVSTLIHETPQISRCDFLDHQASYDQAKQLFASDPIVWQSLTVATTPPVYRCTLTSAKYAPAVHDVFTGVPGVLRASYPAASVRVMQRVAGVLQTILLVIALVLLVSSLVLILNAIRMAIFSRRREVGVMKLVGATDWFIRVPFMLEGLVQGVLGAAVAAGVVILGSVGVRDLVQHYQVSSLQAAVVSGGDLLAVEILVVVIGAVVGVLGSALAVHRFLDV